MTTHLARHASALHGVVALAAAILIGGCAPADPAPPFPTQVTTETLTPGDVIPLPSGEVVLTVGGDIAKPNAGATVSLDMATLERLGLVKYEVHDPWLDEDLEFTGVLLSDLLETVGARSTATTLHLVALDDYSVEIAVADARRWPILLATQTNGEPMALAEMGPTRIVFPYDQYPEIDPLKHKDLWIWMIESIEVR